jgi:hypothetical protein
MFYFSRSENIQERSARFTSGLPKKKTSNFYCHIMPAIKYPRHIIPLIQSILYIDFVLYVPSSHTFTLVNFRYVKHFHVNKHVKVLHYFVDDIKWLKWYLLVNYIDVLLLTEWKYTRKIGAIYFRSFTLVNFRYVKHFHVLDRYWF